jgi:branched-chain amino acid transport system ATP-binding protein
MNVLSVRNLSVSYGGVRALSEVDLDVGRGELVGLIGPNGAGKTTFIDAITGFTPYRGRVELAGADLVGLRPDARVRRGLARTWQSIELFDGLTVAENVAVGAAHTSVWTMLRETIGRPKGITGDALDALTVLGLADRAEAPATDLSQGERKLVGVARALSGKPSIICLDEPAAGLDSHESVQLGRRLRAITEAGVSMLLVDHDMALVLDICDTVVVLEFGNVIAAGTPDRVRTDPAVVAAYLGGAATALAPAKEAL